MIRYLEIGFGNRWFLRTETEFADGTESEVRGWKLPIQVQSVYLRLWLLRQVVIWDSHDGLVRQQKAKKRFKLVFGIRSKEELGGGNK